MQKSLLIGLFLLALPHFAWAEVMDKELPLAFIWFIGLVGAGASFYGFFRNWWFLIVPLFSIIYLLAVILELMDPFVGPAIIEEAGIIYPISTYLSLIGIILASIAGHRLRQEKD